VLREEPAPMTQSGGASVPVALERIVGYCLEKEPARRMQSAHDLAIALEALAGGSGAASGAALAVADPPPARMPKWMAAAAVVVGAALAGLAFIAGRATVGPAPVPMFTPLTFQSGYARAARFGPEPSTVIYSARWGETMEQLYTVRAGSPESSAFGPRGLTLAAVSPSGELAVLRDAMAHPANPLARVGTLARMPSAGGAPRDVLENVEGADWSRDGNDLVVVRTVAGRARIEFPIGTVVFDAPGWIDGVRMAPDGASIAFAEHPLTADDRGWVSVVDLRSKAARRLTSERTSLRGIAWRGREILFGGGSEVMAVAPDGSLRRVTSGSSATYVCDVAPDGTVLVNLVDLRFGTRVLSGASEERDLSWLDATVPVAFWPDGRRLLFWEGFRYGAYARDLDGSPAVRLGDGTPMALSPDGRSVMAVQHTEPMRLALYPTGAGQPRLLPTGDVARISWGHWTPDGRRVLFSGEEPGKGERVYAVSVDGGEAEAISPEGTALVRFAGDMVTPDGRFVLGTAGGRAYVLVPLGGGAPHPIEGFRDGDQPMAWDPDGRAFLVYERTTTWPLQLMRVEVATGTRRPWRTIVSTEREPFLFSQVVVSRDRESMAFLVNTTRSTLFTLQTDLNSEVPPD
jgi:dipeptidyl aminopeptidase/acylaminoacyl peptidase